MLELARTPAEILGNGAEVFYLGALAAHLADMEAHNQEPSGEYTEVLYFDHEGTCNAAPWPLPMPKREPHIVLGEE